MTRKGKTICRICWSHNSVHRSHSKDNRKEKEGAVVSLDYTTVSILRSVSVSDKVGGKIIMEGPCEREEREGERVTSATNLEIEIDNENEFVHE